MAPKHIFLIGASTGGPGLIESIVSSLTTDIDLATVIAQHMDSCSLASFSKRLNRLSGLPSTLVDSRTILKKGHIYTLSDTTIISTEDNKKVLLPQKGGGFYHPSIDTLFESAAALIDIKITAILLSGIGSDGAAGLLKLKEAGHKTIAQDEATSIVYGMPKAAAELGAATQIASIDEIISYIKEHA